MPIQNRELSGAPTITIDVIQLLHNVGLSNKEIKAYTSIVKRQAVKKEIGQRAIETILKNTNDGYDKDGKRFTKYSKSYRESTEFKIYKGGKRTPDLKLTGAMQSDLEVLSASGTTVTIGFTDIEESEKAKGHILGARYLPKRDFFGLKKVDLHKIMLDVISEYEADKDEFIEQVETLENIGDQDIDFENFEE